MVVESDANMQDAIKVPKARRHSVLDMAAASDANMQNAIKVL
jgi:hypothetical protein